MTLVPQEWEVTDDDPWVKKKKKDNKTLQIDTNKQNVEI